jgi:cytochrome c peroxidase
LVHPDDGVLGSLSRFPQPGLNTTYRDLIAAAFGNNVANDAENRFSRIWGEAIQAYESTLIPDQTPLDRFLAGDTAALTQRQQQGLGFFRSGAGRCSNCHAGPEISDATFTFASFEGLINEDGGDQGFHNIGVTPTTADLGRAGTGPRGASFSVSGSSFDRGAFKTASLRNVGLTAPYFHAGAKQTLAEVVDFYSRGGDFANPEKASRVNGFGISLEDRDALVDFLTNGLTDCRVKRRAAPFDHPQLQLTDGRVVGPFGSQGDTRVSCP